MSFTKGFGVVAAFLLFVSCGENAHLTAPSPNVGLNAAFSGDYEIDFGLDEGTGLPITEAEEVVITLSGPGGSPLYFSGSFQIGMDLTEDAPSNISGGSLMPWSKIKKAVKKGKLTPGEKIIFSKKIWAEDEGNHTYHYRLFENKDTYIAPENRRAAVPLVFTTLVRNQYGLSSKAEVVMPVRYRYVFDDEANGRGVDEGGGVRSYLGEPLTNRAVAGLERVSDSSVFLRTNGLCRGDFGLSYDFDYSEVSGDFTAEVTGFRYSSGAWSGPLSFEGDSLLTAVGEAFGKSAVSFEDRDDYGGRCLHKIWGIILIENFVEEDLSGLKILLKGATKSSEVIYGLTKMEAF